MELPAYRGLQSPPGTARILVVDDDPALRDTLSVMLVEHGLAVETAANASQALRTVERNKPDVVLVDLGMPDIDGWEIIRAIRTMRTTKRPHIIVMSGFTDARSRQLAFEAGGDQYVVKEAGADALVSAVRTYLRRAYS